MGEASPVDHMDIDSTSLDRGASKNEQYEATFLKDDTDGQFQIVDHELTLENPFYKHPNKPLELASEPEGLKTNSLESQRVKSGQHIQNTDPKEGLYPKIGSIPQNADAEKISVSGSKTEELDKSYLEKQMQDLRNDCAGQISDLRSKVSSLESTRQPTNANGPESRECGSTLSVRERQKYDEILRLRSSNKEMEEHINALLNAQEHSIKYQKEMEARYRNALNHIDNEKHAREESELNLRSQIMAIQGTAQKEKERAQRYMKTMAEMQSADAYKLDNATIISSAKELRYDIKNWAWAQRLIPSVPAQGLISTYASRALGVKEKGPNYDFLREVHPLYQEYTESPQDFKWLLQAYVWKRIVELVFIEDLWAGVRKSLHDEDTDQKLQVGYRQMKFRLEPGENSPPTYVAQYHEWRSNTCRLISQLVTPERRKRTIDIIRDDILRPLLRASEPLEQEIRNIEDLESIIDAAMRLGASLAEQKACFALELIPVAAYGKLEFRATHMTDPYPAGEGERWDARSHFRAVWLGTAPRLLKWGTSEGTGFDACAQLLEAEVETRVLQKSFVMRRKGI